MLKVRDKVFMIATSSHFASSAEQGDTQILNGTVHKIIDLTMRDIGVAKECLLSSF